MGKFKGDDKAAIMKVIQEETAAFWHKDYKAFARYWVHAGYVQHHHRTPAGGIAVLKGWGSISKTIRQYIEENPKPNPAANRAKRRKVSLRIGKDMAWISYEQHEIDSGEPGMDKPELSRETKILEKHDGKWKLVYVGIVPRIVAT
jgi:hypothetical protein